MKGDCYGIRRKEVIVIETNNTVPIWEKSNLTLEEATAYSGIGINIIRNLSMEKNCNFVLFVGTKRMIKCRLFDEYIMDVKIREGACIFNQSFQWNWNSGVENWTQLAADFYYIPYNHYWEIPQMLRQQGGVIIHADCFVFDFLHQCAE